MSTKKKAEVVVKEVRSLALAKKGIHNASEMMDVRCAVIADTIEGSLSPAAANATCNAAGKALKLLELGQQYGASNRGKKFFELGQ